MVKLLVDHVSNKATISALGFCRSVPMTQLLLEHGADLNVPPPFGSGLPLFTCTRRVLYYIVAEPMDDAYEAVEFIAKNVRTEPYMGKYSLL